MMAFLIVALFTLALFHWAYEFAIAPSMRLGARHKLFRIRDDLRTLASTKEVVLNHHALQTLEAVLNSALEHTDDYDLSLFVAFTRRLSTDEDFRRRVEQRAEILSEYWDPDFVQLRRRYRFVFREIVMINMGGWLVYVVPVVVIAICWEWLRKQFLLISVVPERDVHALADAIDGRCTIESA